MSLESMSQTSEQDEDRDAAMDGHFDMGANHLHHALESLHGIRDRYDTTQQEDALAQILDSYE